MSDTKITREEAIVNSLAFNLYNCDYPLSFEIIDSVIYYIYIS